MQVPLDEPKTQRSIILPDRLWEFAKRVDKSYSKGIRELLEESYQVMLFEKSYQASFYEDDSNVDPYKD